MAIVLTGCGSSESSSGGGAAASGAPADSKKAGDLNICADLGYPPMTFMKDNNPAGFDVDLANALAAKMGVQAKFQQTGFPNIIAALQSGKCDAIMNGMNGTPARGEQIAMIPYLEDGHGFAVAKDNPKNITGLDDLTGKRVATQLGSSNQEFLEEQSKSMVDQGKEPIEIVSFPQDTAAFAALGTGKVDAFFQDLVVLGYYGLTHPDKISIANVSANKQTVVIGTRKNDTDLIDSLTKSLDELYQDGTVSQIAKTWGIPDINLLKSPDTAG
ncbi:ABC transporter substrate-binding protein [Sphaerimonospora cavernae]|uniref:ABC transporter substrate-binding protein n=1 Tax=Sphaerimonospora cavernae TaxID=1740611 RepID=A0ABV6U1L2_9ACTN